MEAPPSVRESFLHDDPLAGDHVSGFSVEWIPAVGPNRKYLCLARTASTGRIIRGEINYRRCGKTVESRPLWVGCIDCPVSYVDSEFSKLTAIGLGEIGDFTPDGEFLDGEWYVLRSRKPGCPRFHEAVLFCPELSRDARVRKLTRAIDALLAREQTYFARAIRRLH